MPRVGNGRGPGVPGHVIGQELQGDEAVKPGVLGLVDHTHAPAAELLDNAVVRDGLADQFEGDSAPWEAILGGWSALVNRRHGFPLEAIAMSP